MHYQLTFAAVAKHLDVLHRAKLINKNRRGKEQIVSISANTLAAASNYLETYKQLWENRLDSLDKYLKLISAKGRSASSGNKNKKGKNNATN